MASASAAAGAGPPSLAGVGIFFQQDSDTNEIFVKTIVKGGSADRSGVLRVGDVVVQVDQANVEGQPLAMLRSRILGPQGAYVSLGFRRREGTETTLYDVALMRGSPEYFEGLKTTQPLQDEIERLKRQNAHLEAQRAEDAAELERYRQHMQQQRQQFDSKFLAMDEALARKDAELEQLRAQAQADKELLRGAEAARADLLRLKETLSDDTRRAQEAEAMQVRYTEEMKAKFEEKARRLEAQVRQMEAALQSERWQRQEAETREARLAEDARRRQEESKARRAKEVEARTHFEVERKRLNLALKLSEDIGGMLREVEPGLTRAHTDLYLQADPALTCAQPPSVASTLPTASRPSLASFHERGGGFGSLSIQGSAVLGQEGREEVGGAGVRDDDDSFFMA